MVFGLTPEDMGIEHTHELSLGTPTLLDSALDVLWSISWCIPTMWSDCVRDGYITLNISADIIHELERVLYVSEAD